MDGSDGRGMWAHDHYLRLCVNQQTSRKDQAPTVANDAAHALRLVGLANPGLIRQRRRNQRKVIIYTRGLASTSNG